MYAERYDEALVHFRRACALAPQAKLLINIIVAALQRGECGAARDDLRLLNKRWPDYNRTKVDKLLTKVGECQ